MEIGSKQDSDVKSLIQKATTGERIDKKKLSPQVKAKLQKIGSFDLVVNAILDDSSSSRASANSTGRRRSLFKDGQPPGTLSGKSHRSQS